MSQSVWHGITLVLVVAFALQAFLLIAVMRQLGAVMLRVGPARAGLTEEGPEVDTPVEIPGISAGHAAVVVFLAPGCAPCEALAPSLPALHRDYGNREAGIDIVPAVVQAENGDGRALAARLGRLARTDLAHLYSEWAIPGTPFAVSVDQERRVRLAGVVNSLEQLEVMVAAALEPRTARETTLQSAEGGVHV